jgi:hypothetical protein
MMTVIKDNTNDPNIILIENREVDEFNHKNKEIYLISDNLINFDGINK